MDSLHIVLPATFVFFYRKRLGDALRTLAEKVEKRVWRQWRSWRRRPLKRKAKVAVVGAGVGGSSAAFFLKDALGDDVELYVYEASDRIGGRCRYIEFPRPRPERSRADAEPADADRASEPRTEFETGASIISELNLYFQYFMKLGHFRKNDRDVPDLPQVIFGECKDRVFASEVGVPTKKGFVPLPFAWRLKIADRLTLLKVIRKYGFFQLRKLKGLLKKKKVLDFGELYKRLNGGEAFGTVEELIQLTGCTGGSCGNSCFGIFRNSPDETITPSDLLKMSAYDTIKSIDGELKDPVLNDLVSPNMRCNYGGQGLHDLHGFVGMVSVAGGICSSCFSVKDGNRDVIVNLLENETEVEHLCLNTRVERVQLTEGAAPGAGGTAGGKYKLHLSQSTRDADGVHVANDTWQESNFDVVIYAAPLINKSTPSENRPAISESSAQCPSPKDAPVFQPEVLVESDRSKYRRCVCTLVQGELSQNFFRKMTTGDSKTATEDRVQKSKDSLTCTESLPYLSALTSADSEEVPFHSLSLLFPCNRTDLQKYITEAIDRKETVFKIFSPAKLSDEKLGELFVDYDPQKTPVHVDDWLAYPEYTVPQSLSAEKFALSESDTHLLLYSNPIELSAGAMEMSAIGGKNAANYCVKWLKKNLK